MLLKRCVSSFTPSEKTMLCGNVLFALSRQHGYRLDVIVQDYASCQPVPAQLSALYCESPLDQMCGAARDSCDW